MMDNLTPEQRRKNMQSIRSAGTKAESMIIDRLTELGLEFVSYNKTIIGKPDVAFPMKKVAVFIDSDFWHCNPKRFVKPKTNIAYWEKKIRRNRERDCEVNRKLKAMDWCVVRVWEYDVKHSLDRCIGKILRALSHDGLQLESS